MASLKFPDTGTRMVLVNGRPALNATGYLYADEELTTPAEVYRDDDGTKGALITPDSDGRRSITLDAYGRQVDYWGPEDGTSRLWIVVNGVASPVDADYNPRLAAVESLAETSLGDVAAEAEAREAADAAVASAAADDATAKADAAQAAAISAAATDATSKADAAQAAAQAFAVQRANHTGTQSADTLTDGTTNKAFTAAERTKLTGIATGATANSTDSQLRDRSTHTGSQAMSTVTGLTTALDGKVAKGDLLFNVRDYGAVGNGTTDDTAAIQAANDAADAAGGRLFGRGTFRINSTVYLTAHCEMASATFDCYSTGISVQVGKGPLLSRRFMSLPRLHCRTKPALGWAAGTEGLRLLNVYECMIFIPFVWHFETNLHMRGETIGTVYNTLTIGSLSVGKVNQLLSADATGWCNQNTFLGGRWSANPAEGTAVPGSAQIRLISDPPYSRPNNNVWVNPSVEGAMHEYMIDCDGGENIWINGRYEIPGGTPQVRWDARSYYNLILGGHSSSLIEETIVTGATSNAIWSPGRWDYMGSKAAPMVRFDNRNSGNQPAWAIWQAATYKDGTTNVDTGWRVAAAANALGVKTASQTDMSAALLPADGSIAFGSGTGAPTRKLRAFGSGVGVDSTHLSWVQHGTYDVGLPANRPRTIRASNAVVVGVYTTEQRNTLGANHASLGAGAMIFDSDLGIPIWSNGTDFVDATGTVV